jgi:hypothetical protein
MSTYHLDASRLNDVEEEAKARRVVVPYFEFFCCFVVFEWK